MSPVSRGHGEGEGLVCLRSVCESGIQEEKGKILHAWNMIHIPPCQMSFHTDMFPIYTAMHNSLVHAATVEQSV